MKETRKELEGIVEMELSETFKRISEIEKRIRKEPYVYTDIEGKAYSEPPSHYNDKLARAMAADMFQYEIVFSADYPVLEEKVHGWVIKMSKLNFRLGRMIDDNAGDRPMQAWKYKKTYKFMEQIKSAMEEASRMNKETPDQVLAKFISSCKAWAVRVICMNTWAYYLEGMRDNKRRLDTSRIIGLDEDRQKLMEIICSIYEILAKLSINIPVSGEDHKYVTDMMERFEMMGQIVLEPAA